VQRTWSTSAAIAAAALAMTTACAGAAQQPLAVHIETPAAGADPHQPPTVTVDNVEVPNSGAIVTVSARRPGAAHDTKLASMFIVGSMQRSGTQSQHLTAAIDAPPGALASLAHDPKATVTVVVCKTGGSCTTSAPLPLRVVRAQ
jgi:hypothetical protein